MESIELNKVSPSALIASLPLAKKDLTKLEFCQSSKAANVQEWVDSLKATQVMQTSAALYQAVPEIPRLKTDFKNHLDILENLRPSVQNCIFNLTKHFLHQSLVLSKDSQKAAIVAQSLQKNMVEGYLSCIATIVDKGKANKKTLDSLGLALHRAITGIGFVFLRSAQIYTPAPNGLWQKLHALYQIADFFELSQVSIVDPMLKFSSGQTIESAYLRVLMMNTIKSNQMNQNDICAVYDAFETWTKLVKLVQEKADSSHLFSVDLDQDKGPLYKAKSTRQPDNTVIDMDFSRLLSQMNRYLGETDDEELITPQNELKTPTEFTKTLYGYLADCWRHVAERQQDRKDVQSAADICVGLVDTHFYLCNGQEFSYFVKNSGKEEHIHNLSRFTPRDRSEEQPQKYDRPVFRVSILNTSASGYCLLWQGNVPAKIESGELIGVKEIGRRTWSIGVVRWIKQMKQASQLGVQLLSTTPKPFGVASTYGMGGQADYSRAIYIPSSRFGNETATILTPAVPFQEHDRIQVLDGDQEWAAKLEKNQFHSGSVTQFSFRPLNEGNSESSDNSSASWD